MLTKPIFKFFFLTVSLFLTITVKAQTEIKINALFAPAGIYNIAVEKPISNKITLQAEVFISPWKSFDGRNLQAYMGTLEGRYYFGEKMKKWYVGTYISMAAFNLQKWNYWNDRPVLDENQNPERLPDGSIRVTGRYQKGLAFIFGISGGYHFTINENWGLDLYAGIGTTQSFYKGYFKDNNQRYEGATKFNKSGELIPTRGGLMLTYKIK